jgi:6,7-dimethyl-8-ribityllumazine synthase
MSQSSQNLITTDNLLLPKSQVVVVYTEWNIEIINELRKGVHNIISKFSEITIQEIQVPGAVEIPFAVRQAYLANKETRTIVFIALGCVIKGETPHFDYVCDAVTQGISHLNTTINAATIFGILTVHNESQAWERLGGIHGHKGEEAAVAALKILAMQKQLFNI